MNIVNILLIFMLLIIVGILVFYTIKKKSDKTVIRMFDDTEALKFRTLSGEIRD